MASPHPRETKAGLRRRTVLVVAVAWTLLVVGLAAWVLQGQLRSVREQVHASAGIRLEAVTDTLTVGFQQLAALPASLSRRHAVVDFLSRHPLPALDGPSDRDKIARLDAYRRTAEVQAMQVEMEEVGRDFGLPLVALLDPQGRIVVSTIVDRAPLPTDLSRRDYFVGAMKDGAASQFLLGRVSGVAGVYFANRIDDAGKVLGAAVVKQDSALLNRLLGSIEGATVILTDTNGTVVLANRPQLVLQRLPAAATTDRTDWRAVYQRQPQDLAWPARLVRVGDRDVTMADIDGRQHIVRSAAVPGVPFTAWVFTPLDEAAVRTEIVVAASAAWFFAMLVIGFGWRRVQWLEVALQARRQIGELAQALPLTVFRYEQPARGSGSLRAARRRLRTRCSASRRRRCSGIRRCRGGWPAASTACRRPRRSSSMSGAARRAAGCAPHSTPTIEADGTTTYNGYWLDVSTARRVSEARFAAVFEHASAGFLFFDREHGVVRLQPTRRCACSACATPPSCTGASRGSRPSRRRCRPTASRAATARSS